MQRPVVLHELGQGDPAALGLHDAVQALAPSDLRLDVRTPAVAALEELDIRVGWVGQDGLEATAVVR